MPFKEQKFREKTLKWIYKATIVSAVFSLIFTSLDFIIFKNFYILYGVFITFTGLLLILVNYHLTFKKRIISFVYSILIFLTMFLSSLIILTYLAGGFAGSMISAFYIFFIISALLLGSKHAVYASIFIILIYLIFFFGETYNIIIPVVQDEAIIKYSKAIIDVLGFIIVSFLVVIIAKNAEDSIKFYKLRSVRLSKIRKRMQVLVKRRTKELEESNRKLRDIDKKKDEFISIASHELQTPMASIHGFAQLLQDKKVFKDPEKRKKYLKIIEDETNRLSKMVKDMLNLSRIDLGTIKFDIEEVDVAQLLEELRLQLESAAKQKGLKLAVQTEKDLPKITTDKEKLQQTLINLITNSIKYTNKGSITISAQRENNHILFSVADTGIGIPKSQYDKIFERFYQIESPATRKVLGAGLGLSLVKEFVHVLGGKIRLKSKVGKGTTFYFTLPLKFKPSRRKYQSK